MSTTPITPQLTYLAQLFKQDTAAILANGIAPFPGAFLKETNKGDKVWVHFSPQGEENFLCYAEEVLHWGDYRWKDLPHPTMRYLKVRKEGKNQGAIYLVTFPSGLSRNFVCFV